jgi:hypothetical protein
MGVLKLRAIYFYAGAGIAKEALGERFDHAGLARPGRTEEEQIPDGPVRRVQACQEHLINFNDLFNGSVLANDLAAKADLKVTGVCAPAIGIENGTCNGLHEMRLLSFFGLRGVAAVVETVTKIVTFGTTSRKRLRASTSPTSTELRKPLFCKI